MLVPKLRFKEFNNEWISKKLGDTCNINPNNEVLPYEFMYIDLESVVSGRLINKKIININNAPSRAKRILKQNDILFQTVRPYQMNNYFFNDIYNISVVASTGYAQIRTKCNSKFIYYLLHTEDFQSNVELKCTGSNYPAINSMELSNIFIYLPSLEEQTKIANFLSLIDRKIELQEKLVENLKLYKKGLLKKVFSDNHGWKINQIGNICDISTGSSNTQDSIDNGIYPFFIRSNIIKKSNKYLYDGEAVLTVGDGNIGKVFHYINGKFDYHQRVYKISDFKKYNIISGKYFYYYFSTFFYHHVMKLNAKNTVNSVRLNMISKMNIRYPSIEEQNRIANLFTNLDKKIDFETKKLQDLKTYKKGLLQKMFI